jgi:hypothetical protein
MGLIASPRCVLNCRLLDGIEQRTSESFRPSCDPDVGQTPKYFGREKPELHSHTLHHDSSGGRESVEARV